MGMITGELACTYYLDTTLKKGGMEITSVYALPILSIPPDLPKPHNHLSPSKKVKGTDLHPGTVRAY